MKKSVIRTIAFATCVFVPIQSSVGSQFIPLWDFPEGNLYSLASSISTNGAFVAGSGSRIFSNDISDAFLWSQDDGLVNLQSMPIIASPFTGAWAVSDNGFVVGVALHNVGAAGSFYEPFRWTSLDGFSDLGHLPGATTTGGTADDISADGRKIVGGMDNSSGHSEAFVWTAETGAVGLGDLPGGEFSSYAVGISSDGSAIAGNGASDLTTEAFRWTAATGMTPLGFLPGGYPGYARAISSDGSTIVGWGYSPLSGFGGEAFRWTEQTGMQLLGDVPGGDFTSVACAVSADGAIVLGGSSALPFDATERHKAFVWDEAHGMRDLQTVLMNDYGLASTLAGWQLFTATGISDDGLSIIGSGINPDGNTEAWLVRLDRPITVPEPTTATLLLLAAMILFTRSHALRGNARPHRSRGACQLKISGRVLVSG